MDKHTSLWESRLDDIKNGINVKDEIDLDEYRKERDKREEKDKRDATHRPTTKTFYTIAFQSRLPNGDILMEDALSMDEYGVTWCGSGTNVNPVLFEDKTQVSLFRDNIRRKYRKKYNRGEIGFYFSSLRVIPLTVVKRKSKK